MQIPEISHGIYFLEFPQTIFQEPQMYTNKHNHQHKIKQQYLFHLVHTFNIKTYGIEIV